MSNPIHKISQIFLFISWALLILLPIMVFCQWFLIDIPFVKNYVEYFGFFNPIKTGDGSVLVNIAIHTFTWQEKCIGFIGTLIGLLPLFLALIVLIPIFKNYSSGNIFSLKNARHYQQLGYIFIFDSLLAKPISQAVLTIAATLSNPPGQRQMMVSIGMINLESLFCGAIIIVIARVMYLGNKLQEEQRLVI